MNHSIKNIIHDFVINGKTPQSKISGTFVFVVFLRQSSLCNGIYFCLLTGEPTIVEFFNPLNGQSVFSPINDVHIISKPEFKAFHERKKLERFLERTKTPEPPHSELSWPVYCAENYNGE